LNAFSSAVYLAGNNVYRQENLTRPPPLTDVAKTPVHFATFLPENGQEIPNAASLYAE
jgi:hypothetical protein